MAAEDVAGAGTRPSPFFGVLLARMGTAEAAELLAWLAAKPAWFRDDFAAYPPSLPVIINGQPAWVVGHSEDEAERGVFLSWTDPRADYEGATGEMFFVGEDELKGGRRGLPRTEGGG